MILGVREALQKLQSGQWDNNNHLQELSKRMESALATAIQSENSLEEIAQNLSELILELRIAFVTNALIRGQEIEINLPQTSGISSDVKKMFEKCYLAYSQLAGRNTVLMANDLASVSASFFTKHYKSLLGASIRTELAFLLAEIPNLPELLQKALPDFMYNSMLWFGAYGFALNLFKVPVSVYVENPYINTMRILAGKIQVEAGDVVVYQIAG